MGQPTNLAHITLKPAATARSTDTIPPNEPMLGPFNCPAAPFDDDDAAALPVAEPDPAAVLIAVGIGPILIVTLLTAAGELSVEFVSVVPLINHPSSVLLAPNGGVCGPSVPFFRPPVRLVAWFVLPWTQ